MHSTSRPGMLSPLRKVARIWSVVILVLGFLVLVSETIEAASTTLEPMRSWENLIPLTLLFSVVGLAIAFREEGLGGAITVLSVLANFVLYLLAGRTRAGVVALILIPILIPGMIFLVCWWRTRPGRLLKA